MNTTDLYKHKHFGNLVQITAQGGTWVEFLSKGSLFWLEQLVFDHAYTYYRDGDPIVVDLTKLRATAQASGILIPREIQETYIDIED
jgi:hypothetical protein